MKWQPIETAPRDETHILGLENGDHFECWYEMPPSPYLKPRWQTIVLDIHGCGCCGGDYPNPTHWMPLPEPPEDV